MNERRTPLVFFSRVFSRGMRVVAQRIWSLALNRLSDNVGDVKYALSAENLGTPKSAISL